MQYQNEQGHEQPNQYRNGRPPQNYQSQPQRPFATSNYSPVSNQRRGVSRNSDHERGPRGRTRVNAESDPDREKMTKHSKAQAYAAELGISFVNIELQIAEKESKKSAERRRRRGEEVNYDKNNTTFRPGRQMVRK